MMATFPAKRWATPPTSMTRLSPASISATSCLCSLFFIWWSIRALRLPFLQAGSCLADIGRWGCKPELWDLQEAVQKVVHQG